MLGDSSLSVVSTPGRFLRADVHVYKLKYTKVLEQQVDRHRMFEKPTDSMGIPDVALDKYGARINKWDDELTDFMLSASGAPSSRCCWEEGRSLLDFRTL